jgi:hypothetical protein
MPSLPFAEERVDGRSKGGASQNGTGMNMKRLRNITTHAARVRQHRVTAKKVGVSQNAGRV